MRRQLLSAFFPVVLFWAIEKYLGLKAALIAGCISAPIELAWERIKFGKISFLTASSNALVLGLGAISFWMDSGVAFKLQPAIMEIAMAVLMVGTRLRGGEPYMVRMFRDAPIEPEKRDAALSQPFFMGRMRAFDTRLILFLIFHGLAVAWAAAYSTTNVWAFLKGVLFYVLLVLVVAPMYKRPTHGTQVGAK